MAFACFIHCIHCIHCIMWYVDVFSRLYYFLLLQFHKDVLSILGAPECFVLSALNLWWAWDEVTGAGRDKCEAVFECFFQDNQRCLQHSWIFHYFVHICCWCWMVHMFMLCSCNFQVILSWLTTTWLCTLRWRHRSWPADEAWATSRSS